MKTPAEFIKLANREFYINVNSIVYIAFDDERSEVGIIVWIDDFNSRRKNEVYRKDVKHLLSDNDRHNT